jgi:hypothetical protein
MMAMGRRATLAASKQLEADRVIIVHSIHPADLSRGDIADSKSDYQSSFPGPRREQRRQLPALG